MIPSPLPPVAYGRLKILGAVVIGGLIALNARSDAELAGLFGPAWGPRARTITAIALGSFYALDKYLSRSPEWKRPAPSEPNP